MQTNLFKPEELPKALQVPPGLRCKNCLHLYNHQYGKMKYCDKQRDPRTSYGNKKIKANDPACPQFEEVEKKQNIKK